MIFGARQANRQQPFVFSEIVQGPFVGWVASASSEYSSTSSPASKAADGLGDREGQAGEYSNRWVSLAGFSDENPTTSGLPWWQMDFGEAKKLYGLQFYVSEYGIKSVEVYGSNSGAFAGEESLLGTITEIIEWGSPNTVKRSNEYPFESPGLYRYLRLVVTSRYDHGSSTFCTINEILFMLYE